MTSTSFNVGLTDNTRLSSRVLRPPGGGHTDIFGGEPEPTTRGRRPAPAANVQSDEAPKSNGAETPVCNGQEVKEAPKPQEVPKSEAPKAVAPKTVTPTEQPKTEAPKRVRVPPGGFSSGLW